MTYPKQLSFVRDALNAALEVRGKFEQGGVCSPADLDQLKLALGRIETRLVRMDSSVKTINDAEFQVFSQFGEDGILQHLIRCTSPSTKVFVEFGVEDYRESNTRFLLMKDNWAGLIIDGSESNIQKVRHSDWYWKYNIKAVSSFVTSENINDLLTSNGIKGEIGILSVDIDGNDYWVWRAIDVVSPVIVVAEYNHRFGADLSVTIPYQPDFNRWDAPDLMYLKFGASLRALCRLANKKGYAFVGCNSGGVNAFFVRRDKLASPLREMSPEEGFVQGQFREPWTSKGTILTLDEEHSIAITPPLVQIGEDGEPLAESPSSGA
jgi:hypothetical protein